jgi:hypothetical protein
MAEPFKCPHCGAHDYVVVLTGCNITGATLHDAYTWSEEAQEYSFGGSLVMESETLENEGGQALCGGCEADVTDAVTAYQASQGGAADDETQA